MTEPSGGTPTTAANYGSLSAWSQKTQGDWQAGISSNYTGTLNGIGSFFGSIFTVFGQLVDGIIGIFLGGIGIIGGIIGGVIGAIASFFGGLFGGFTGAPAPNNQASAFDVHLGADGLRKQVASLTSEVQSLKFDALPPGNGVFIDSAATATDSDWPNFAVSDSSLVQVVASRGFSWKKSGKIARNVLGIYDKQTSSDLMIAGMVLHTLPQAGAKNRVAVRADTAGSNMVWADVYNNKVVHGCTVGGVEKIFETALGAPSPGSLWEVQAGEEGGGANDYRMFVYQNRKTIIDYPDSDHESVKGSSYRSGALGMSSAAGTAEHVPGDIAQFSLRDIAPPTILGTALRVRNLAATPYSMPGLLISSLSNGYFDTVDYCSDDLDWDASLTQATIKTESAYEIKFQIAFTAFHSSVTVYPSYFQNNAVGGSELKFGSGGTDSQTAGVFGSFTTYCVPGDKILPAMGIASSGAISVTGDGTGQFSWMTITKAG